LIFSFTKSRLNILKSLFKKAVFKPYKLKKNTVYDIGTKNGSETGKVSCETGKVAAKQAK